MAPRKKEKRRRIISLENPGSEKSININDDIDKSIESIEQNILFINLSFPL